ATTTFTPLTVPTGKEIIPLTNAKLISALQTAGYNPADEKYGNVKKALEAFQKANDLTADGIAGKDTVAKLNEVNKNKADETAKKAEAPATAAEAATTGFEGLGEKLFPTTPPKETQIETSKKEILKKLSCFNDYNCRGEQLTHKEAYEELNKLAKTSEAEVMAKDGAAKKYYANVKSALEIEGSMPIEEYKEQIDEKVKNMNSQQLRDFGTKTLKVEGGTPLSNEQYAEKVKSDPLTKFKSEQLDAIGASVPIKINRDGKTDTEYRTALTDKINTLNEAQLNQLGEKMQIDRNTMTDEEYRAAVEKALKDAETEAEKELKPSRDLAQTAEDSYWQGSFVEGIGKDAYNVLVQGKNYFTDLSGGVLSLAGKLGSYRSLSNLLVPGATKKWMEVADGDGLRIWSDLDAFAASEYCRKDEEKRSTEEGKAYAFVRTTSGTYQFVGSIQAEKSESSTLLLCTPNPDQEADDKFVCSKGLVCGEDQFCYEDKNNDLEPDNKDPVKGRFYKITWGVTAPQDEKFTPYVDENGKAVRFNLHLYGPEGDRWVFRRLGATGSSVLALENGQNDGGLIVRYLPEDYNRVCIEFNPADSVKDFGGTAISSICTNIIQSSKGKVQYEGASAPATVASGSGEVYMDI
ncbi:MAG: peptidoglycan-binding protein, partial [Nanoarchaeota archaeon]|nr:peptidoglycan-binding protein [Nanoarchaeota archaeon]